MAKINQDILNEVQTIKEIEALEKQNMERLKDLDTVFQKFDNNLNKVGKLIEKVPDDSVVRPNRNWLNMFGLWNLFYNHSSNLKKNNMNINFKDLFAVMLFVVFMIGGGLIIWIITVGIMLKLLSGTDHEVICIIGTVISIWPLTKWVKWLVEIIDP